MCSQCKQNVKSLYFSSSATNISIYHVLMIMPQVLHIFAPYSLWHNLQHFKYSKILTVYIFLTSLCASCFCSAPTCGKSLVENVDGRGFGLSVCKLHLYEAKKSTLMFIIRTLIITVYIYYIILTTNTETNEVSCLLYFRTQHKQYTQCVCKWYLQSL